MTSVTLICGGPSKERGISINSARSIYDHLCASGLEVTVFYVDGQLNFHRLNPAQLYSNTPSDFDYLLAGQGRAWDSAELAADLAVTDIVFPCIHGSFGEDGRLQALLEQIGVPFVGSGSEASAVASDKFLVNKRLAANGFRVLPMIAVDSMAPDLEQRVATFMAEHPQAVVKPAQGGSSIGVQLFDDAQSAAAHARCLLDSGEYARVVVEQRATGEEFTAVVVADRDGAPTAFPPSAVEKASGGLYTFEMKYLPTSDTRRHCPPATWSDEGIRAVRAATASVFTLFNLRDMARIDGWRMEDGQIVFTDINTVSGMEQNSFVFQQASRVGLTHVDLLTHVVSEACRRQNVRFTSSAPPARIANKQEVHVLFGGDTAERQVSVMSGSNVCFKLQASEYYVPIPFLLAPGGRVWKLPYSACLDHTVEEILANCENARSDAERIRTLAVEFEGRFHLVQPRTPEAPAEMSLAAFLENAAKRSAFVFIALHGGMGENGDLQAMLDDHGVSYNGSGPAASRLCIDKLLTGQTVEAAAQPGLISAPKVFVSWPEIQAATPDFCAALWDDLRGRWDSRALLVKPRSDGCSAGILRIATQGELETYFDLVRRRVDRAPATDFSTQGGGWVDLGFDPSLGVLVEPFVETDHLIVRNSRIERQDRSGWIELTVGVYGAGENLKALSPSITVAEEAVLSLAEKFQGGTGVNLTPPPADLISPDQSRTIRRAVEQAARLLGIEGYARLDIFFNTRTDQVLLIEANSLPGLTPSTVIYHQALAERPPLPPRAFLERLIAAKLSIHREVA